MDPDSEVVHGLGRVLPVEVPGGHRLTPLRKHDGVVRGAVHLRGDDAAHKVDGVVRDAVHLGRAPQRVRILNTFICKVVQLSFLLKVHKNENFFGSDSEFCTISLLVMLKY